MTFIYDDPSIGDNLRELLEDSRTWVNRRVDSLRLDADGTTRRFVSLDVTIPANLQCRGSKNRTIVPLGVLSKGTKQRFDASYEGKPLPVLGRKDNAQVVASMLQASLPKFLNTPGSSDPAPKALFLGIASCSQDEAATTLERYTKWIESLISNIDLSPTQHDELNNFHTLVSLMIENFVLLVEVDEKILGLRSVMKYAFDQDEPSMRYPGTRRAVIVQDIPDLGFASSHHVELEVPRGLIVEKLVLAELSGEDDKQSDRIVTVTSKGRVAHVNIEPSSPAALGILRAEVSVAKQGLLSFTTVTLVAILVAVATSMLVRHYTEFFLPPKPQIPSPAASILLIGPALLISWMSRAPEHPMLAGMLKPLRRMTMLAALSLVVMAFLAAVKVQPWIWKYTWCTLLVVALWNVFRLLTFNFNLQLPARLRRKSHRKFAFGVPYRNEEEPEVEKNGTNSENTV